MVGRYCEVDYVKMIEEPVDEALRNEFEPIPETSVELARAALLRLMLLGYRLPVLWWIVAAEAARCFELHYGCYMKKPTIPLPRAVGLRVRQLFEKIMSEEQY